MKSQIQNKNNGGIGELLITLNRVIRNQGTCFVVTMNNRLKISNNQMLPSKVRDEFFKKKIFMRGQKLFWVE